MNKTRNALILLAALSTPALSQPLSSTEIAELRAQLEQLRAEQARAAERISAIEAALDGREPAPATAGKGAVGGKEDVETAAAVAEEPVPASGRQLLAGLDLSGDLRTRFESNFGDADARNRNRLAVRARLRASYSVNDWLTIGTQVVSGDPDDPGSTDATLSGFVDDIRINLDQAWLRATFGGLELYGGKMPLPFLRTDLLWDADVSPQGTAAVYRAPLADAITLRASALYFAIDEDSVGPDSDMVGAQIAIESESDAAVAFQLAAGYYDYSLRSTAGADADDVGTNRFANGRYLSDYDLLDVIASISWNGLGKAWPIRLSGDYVHNFGAPGGINTAYGIDLLVGRTKESGDFRFGYGYASAGTDSVLAAFSHDNTTIPSNYLQHTLVIDYVATKDVILNATLYRFRPKAAIDAGGNAPRDWLNRLRLQMLVNF